MNKFEKEKKTIEICEEDVKKVGEYLKNKYGNCIIIIIKDTVILLNKRNKVKGTHYE